MIDKIVDKIMIRARAKMPEVDDERAEVIAFGLNILIGEIPKLILLFGLSWILGILKYTVISFLIISPYRKFSGGIHLKTHLGCIVGTTIFFCGTAYMSKIINFGSFNIKLVVAVLVWIISIIFISIYAPADTENIPILRKKDRKFNRALSYILVTAMVITSFFVKDRIISNMFIIGTLMQSLTICRLTYNIFKVKYGYLEYIKTQKDAI